MSAILPTKIFKNLRFMTFNPEAAYDAANINSSLGERVIKSHLISKSSIEIQSCSNLVEGMTLSESGGIWNSDSRSNSFFCVIYILDRTL